MSRPLALEVTERAAQQIEDAAEWWRLHRSKAPDAVYEELSRAFELITRHPDAGLRQPHASLVQLRRIYLSRIRMYVYYQLEGEPCHIEVLALWHASRDSEPPL